MIINGIVQESENESESENSSIPMKITSSRRKVVDCLQLAISTTSFPSGSANTWHLASAIDIMLGLTSRATAVTSRLSLWSRLRHRRYAQASATWAIEAATAKIEAISRAVGAFGQRTRTISSQLGYRSHNRNCLTWRFQGRKELWNL